jgi:hypothetical protein
MPCLCGGMNRFEPLIQRIGRQIRTIRPANHAKLINAHLIEEIRVLQRLKNRPEKSVAQLHRAASSVGKRDFQFRARECFNEDDLLHEVLRVIHTRFFNRSEFSTAGLPIG